MSNEKETKVSALDAKAKALANEEDEDTKIAKLLKNMPKWRFYSLAVLTVIWTVFQLYIKLVKPLDPWFQLPLHMCLALVVVWLYNPMVEKSKSHNKLWWIYDIFLIASSCFICWFFLSHAEQLNYRIFNVDVMTTTEVIVAVLLVINVMEAVRRVVSMSLFWVICFFLAYAWFGQYIPGLFRFSGISFPKLMEVLMYGENGIFGSPLVTSLGTLFYFLVFGTFFSNCGGGGVLIDGGMKLSDKTVGGPAKAAVISSGLLGMVSGSAIANVSTTGVLTIPLMKKTGYDPEEAAAVESVASTGGQIMPPIMGSTAFIMAEMLGIPYTAVAKAALIPAILYFLAVLFGVDIYAAKHGLKGIPRSQLPKVRSMLKQIYMLAPLIFLIFCMAVFNMTIVRSGLLTIIVTLVLVEINPKTRMTKEQWLQIPVQTVKSAVSVGIACAMAGIISGVIMGSGLGYRISSILTSVAGTSMLLLLVLTMVVSLIMGMGVPTTAAYLVLASLVAPTMIQLGIPPLAAHMFIFYFGCISSITPPVALAAYAGAGLAGCDPNKTGYKAFRLAFCSFLMPYLFVYNPVLLMEGGVLDILWSLVTALIGAYLLASGFEGFFFRWSLKWFERPLMILGAVMLIVPGMVTDLVGIAIIVVEFVTEFMFKRSEKFVPVTVSQSTT